jgi:hypothetical protein
MGDDPDRVSALEQTVAKMQARDIDTQNKLDLILASVARLAQTNQNAPKTPNPVLPVLPPPTPSRTRTARPAAPPDFDGDRTKGMAFLNSCQTYVRLCPMEFPDDQAKIVWAMSYMKSGRAQKWTARIFRWEQEPDNRDSNKFVDWVDFRDEFKKEFTPAHADSLAINYLESTAYFQKGRSLDDYIDEFRDLITDAGYTDPKTVVVKFRRGLNTLIQNAVATMASGRPSDTRPDQWYHMARVVDQNRASNEAFLSAYNDLDLDQPQSDNPSAAQPANLSSATEHLLMPKRILAKSVQPNRKTPQLPHVNRSPPLPVSNQFSVLPIEDAPQMDQTAEKVSVVQPAETPPVKRTFRPHWERRLPAKLVIASLDGSDESPSRSLNLKVDIEATDSGEVKSVDALVDSGATGRFIDRDYVKANRLTARTLSVPIPVRNVDGTPNGTTGYITEAVDLVLRYKNHSERTLFAVTSLGGQNLILGHSWLQKHNPEIDWVTGEVKMSRCSARCCSGCREEIREERKSQKVEARRIAACSAGDLPDLVRDDDDDDEGDDPEFEQGDRIFVAGLCQPPEEVRATSTISQRLAEAFKRNSEPTPTLTDGPTSAEGIPDYLREFHSVFSKESFDVLPDPKPWDHAVELIPGEKPSGCKVYPLSPSEQKELDAFLQENLESGRIRPSKSPMASPVFFIKKKDGGLRLVQDYRALNAITVKNKYPLPLISELIEKLRGARYFTKLDVRWGFNNVRMKEGDEWKAAFRTNRGLFEPLVMFFGLTNSPATFQTMMNDIFHELIMEGVVVVYLDDILIFTETIEEHRKVTTRVLELLQKHKLFLKPDKCEFRSRLQVSRNGPPLTTKRRYSHS